MHEDLVKVIQGVVMMVVVVAAAAAVRAGVVVVVVFCFWRSSPQWARVSSYTRFLDHTQRRTTVGRTPLDG